MARATLLQACLNGSREPGSHAALPVTPDELARDASLAVAAGAEAVHVHPRGDDGLETLDPEVCDRAVAAIRSRCPGTPVGLTTSAWIEPDPDRRLALVAAWRELPDFASVNFSEAGAVELFALLLDRGVGVEAGLASVSDGRKLGRSRLARRCLRVLVEPQDDEPEAAMWAALAVEMPLARSRAAVPLLVHGQGAATWPVLRFALERGHDVRIGLEDTLARPDGSPAAGNEELVAAARRLIGERGAIRTARE